MKKYDKFAFIALLVSALSCLFISIVSSISDCSNLNKWLSTTSILTALSGVVQLEVSGFFEKLSQAYSDEKKHPYGPPSYVTREFIYNPDTPFRSWLTTVLYFRSQTGFWLIVIGSVIQVFAVWS